MALVVYAQVAEGFPLAAAVAHLVQASPFYITIAAQLGVVPGQRLPILVLRNSIAGVKPSHITRRIHRVLVHARQATFGDDNLMPITILLPNAFHARAIEKRAAGYIRSWLERRPAVFMKTEVFVRLQRAREPVQVMTGLCEIASREIERNSFQIFGLQALTKTDLECLIGAQPLLDFSRFAFEIARGWPRNRLVEAHPGINQQAAVDAFRGVTHVVIQNPIGQAAAGRGWVCTIQHGVLFLICQEHAANDERIW